MLIWGSTIFCCLLIVLIVVLAVVLACKERAIRDELNQQSGFISDNMQRKVMTPRANAYEKVQQYGMFYAQEEGIEWSECEYDAYWNEEGQVVLTQQAEKELMEATFELHYMSLMAVDKVVKDDKLLDLFGIHKRLWPAVKKSWQQKQNDFQGRFDFMYDGKGPPKMLEYNADTPSMIIESGALQEDWFGEVGSKNDNGNSYQSNYIYTALTEAFTKMSKMCENTGFAFLAKDDENSAQMKYLKGFYDTITSQSKIDTLANTRLKYDSDCDPTWRMASNEVDCLVNVYPKEWMITEFGTDGLIKYDVAELRSFEPFWKIILGNKALLPLLWSMYPGHKNLLPAYFDDPRIEKAGVGSTWPEKMVSKPIFGREGLGVMLSKNFSSFDEFVKTTENNFGVNSETNEKLGKSIYQGYVDLPTAQGRIIQASSWVIDGFPAGLMFREYKANENFNDQSPFLLHTVSKGTGKQPINFKMTQEMFDFRNELYFTNDDGTKIQRDPQTRYQKSPITIQTDIVDESYFKNPDSTTHKIIVAEQWNSYLEYKPLIDEQSTDDWVLSQAIINELRTKKCCYEDSSMCQTSRRRLEPEGGYTVDDFLESPQNRNFKEPRRQEIGRVGTLTYEQNSGTGGANWYSVDRRGNVRMHFWYTMGMGRAWGRS